MGVIPSGLHRHGSAELTVTIVVSLHLGGMFAFSPAIGAALDRWGRRPGLFAAGILSISGVLIGALTEGAVAPGAGLFLIGVGWSAAYIGSTAIVSDLSAPAERAAALGMTDLVAGLSAAGGVLGGVVLVEATELSVLGLTAAGLLLVPLSFLVKLHEPPPAPAVAPVRTMCP
jgi:MFS family permease